MEIPASQFAFFTCQPGAEAALKAELAARAPELTPSYSRPGFVTFKSSSPLRSPQQLPQLVFARRGAISLGSARAEQLSDGVRQVLETESVRQLVAQSAALSLHVWERDTLLPGEGGSEPALSPLAGEVHAALQRAIDAARASMATPPAADPGGGAPVLDVVLVSAGEWWTGYHHGQSRIERWPGGLPLLQMPDYAVSRAYLKMAEALKWSALPARPGEHWVELGCAPGGASQALLDRGFRVTGVDPAEVEPVVVDHPAFRHVKKRSADVRRQEFRDMTWLAADLNVAPQYTLDTVEAIVTHSSVSIRGMVLTLKLLDWQMAGPERLSEYVGRVRSWGYRDVRLRQLVHNRRELCLVALRSRAQRRISKRRHKSSRRPGSTRQVERTDAPHASVQPPHFARPE